MSSVKMKSEMQQHEAHHLLRSDPYDSDDFQDLEKTHSESGYRPLSRAVLICLWAQAVLIVVLLGTNYHAWQRIRGINQHFDSVYSPAQSLIKHVNIVSNSSLGHDSDPYVGRPTPERDALWEDLYNFGLSKIPIESAAKLVNRTVPIPGEPGQYIVSLDVFHELHCLNKIRHRLWMTEAPDPEDGSMHMDHLDHCINMMRQNIMCSSDITPLPYIWDMKKQKSMVVGKVQRTCRDFDAIRDWALEHQVHHFDEYVRVEDPLGNMEY